MQPKSYEYDVLSCEVKVTGESGEVLRIVGEKAQKMIVFLKEQNIPEKGTLEPSTHKPQPKPRQTFTLTPDNDAFLKTLPGRSRSSFVNRAVSFYREQLGSEAGDPLETNRIEPD